MGQCPPLLQIWDAAHTAMVQAFGQGFPCDQDLRARLALPLDTSQLQTPRISTVSAEYQAYPGSRVISDHPSSRSRSVPSNHTQPSNIVQQFSHPAQDQSPGQQVMGNLPTHSSTMYFNDYFKMHNQLAIPLPLPLPTVNDPIYASSHGVIPHPSAPEYSPSAHQHYSHTGTWTGAPSGHQSNPSTSMALDDNAGDNWPYHQASFPTGGRGPHGDQGVAHGAGLHTHQNYSSSQQLQGPESSSTSSHKYQTWEELAHELGFHNK